MITIFGKYTNALVYTTDNEQCAIDNYARKQLQMICDHPSAAGSRIRVMPDVHPGKVGTIGLTMTVGESLMPNLVRNWTPSYATMFPSAGRSERQTTGSAIRQCCAGCTAIRRSTRRRRSAASERWAAEIILLK